MVPALSYNFLKPLTGDTVDQFMNNLVQCLLPSAGFRGISNDFTTAFPLAAISWLKGSPLNMTRLWAIPSSNSSDTTLNISLSGGRRRRRSDESS